MKGNAASAFLPTFWIVFPLLAHCAVPSLKAISKPNTLLLFSTIPYTGMEPMDGMTCQRAMQLAVNIVNAGPEYLPDFKIQPDFQDEGALSRKAAQQFNQFLQRAKTITERPSGSTTYLAPAIVGTTNACDKIANLVRDQNMVQFTPGCGEVEFLNRTTYPNLYRTKIPNEALYLTPLVFYLYGPAKLKRIGIVSDGANLDGIKAVLNGQGREVVDVRLAETSDIDTAVQAMNQSNARVIYIDLSNMLQMKEFMCTAHRNGIRPPEYFFIARSLVYVDPSALLTSTFRNGCTRAMVAEQIQATFWAGPGAYALSPHGKTTFGYDLDEFESALDSMTNRARWPDYPRRHHCFDTMAQALLSLDKANRDLELGYNKTIKNFKTDLELVRNAVNKAAVETDFVGLRIGRIKYTSRDRLEVDNETQYVTQWVNNETRILYEIRLNTANIRNIFNPRAYLMVKVAEPTWFTADKEAPKDNETIGNVFDVQLQEDNVTRSSELPINATAVAAVKLGKSAAPYRNLPQPSLVTFLFLLCILLTHS